MTRFEAEPPYALKAVPAPRLTDFREADFVPSVRAMADC